MLPRRPAALCAHHLIFCSAMLLPAALALKSASDSSSRLGSLSTESTTSSPGCFAGLSLGSQQGQAARQQLSAGQQGAANLSSLPGGWLQMADPEGAHREMCLHKLYSVCCLGRILEVTFPAGGLCCFLKLCMLLSASCKFCCGAVLCGCCLTRGTTSGQAALPVRCCHSCCNCCHSCCNCFQASLSHLRLTPLCFPCRSELLAQCPDWASAVGSPCQLLTLATSSLQQGCAGSVENLPEDAVSLEIKTEPRCR